MNVQIVYKWMSQASKRSPLTKPIICALINHFGDEIYDQTLIGFTELKQNGNLYRACIEYRKKGCWFDNVLIAWEKNKRICIDNEQQIHLVPSELRLFFKFEKDAALYCIVHSCGFENVKNSVLSIKWKKEYTS